MEGNRPPSFRRWRCCKTEDEQADGSELRHPPWLCLPWCGNEQGLRSGGKGTEARHLKEHSPSGQTKRTPPSFLWLLPLFHVLFLGRKMPLPAFPNRLRKGGTSPGAGGITKSFESKTVATPWFTAFRSRSCFRIITGLLCFNSAPCFPAVRFCACGL